MGIGQTATITWAIVGTTKPVHMQLKNTHPETATLERGNIQTATSSGGNKNIVSRKVTGLSEGEFNVDVEVLGTREDPKIIESAFRRELRRIAAETKKAAKRLPVDRRTIAREDVLALIDHAQQDVIRSLPFDDLAAFRDAVAALVEDLHRDAEAMTLARGGSRSIFLVQNRPASAPRLAENDARSFIDRFVDLLNGSSRSSPQRTICVMSSPESGALVRLYAVSFPTEGDIVISTNPTTLYMGLYAYELTQKGDQTHKGKVDLLTKPGHVLHCSLICELLPRTEEKCE